MLIEGRSRQLKPDAVTEAENKLNNIKYASRVRDIVSATTLRKMLSPEPVLVSLLKKVFAALDLTLEERHLESISARRPSPPPTLPPPGIITVASFPVSECIEKIKSAKRVWFLSTWLVYREGLARLLVQGAGERAGETRILVLDPESAHVAHRGSDLNSSSMATLTESNEINAAQEEARANVHRNILSSLEEISHQRSRQPPCERLRVGVYDSTPTMTLLIVDDYVCQGFHWRDHHGSVKPHLVYTQDQNPLLYSAVVDHFNAVWNSNTTCRYDVATKEIVRDADFSRP